MKIKFLLLLLLGVSFLFFGCAKKGEETNVTQTPNATQNISADDQELADLFQIDTDRPLGDEGLDTGTPSSQN
ncbi:hypothetical protein KKB44_00905 [Candidatus Micrarchaeota archaeon]|nr:hypothetical protein [Candidatus Micrarchaeota archaeon]